MKHPVLACSALLLTCACGAEPDSGEGAAGERHDHFRWTGLGVDHNDITEDALPFLPSAMADLVGDHNEDVDGGSTKLQSKYHVDNCRIQEGFDTVRARYQLAVDALAPGAARPYEAIRFFGSLTHTVQDFFAHSNWVEGGQTALIGANGFQFPAVATGAMLGGMMVLTETLPVTYTIDLPPGSRVPIVRYTSAGPTYKGLITGTYSDNTDRSICPIEASLEHGGMLSQGRYDTFLAKDDPDSPHHAQAVAIARRQTTEEFCRLARLVLLRYGRAGLDNLIDTFDANRRGYEAACPWDKSIVAGVVMTVI